MATRNVYQQKLFQVINGSYVPIEVPDIKVSFTDLVPGGTATAGATTYGGDTLEWQIIPGTYNDVTNQFTPATDMSKYAVHVSAGSQGHGYFAEVQTNSNSFTAKVVNSLLSANGIKWPIVIYPYFDVILKSDPNTFLGVYDWPITQTDGTAGYIRYQSVSITQAVTQPPIPKEILPLLNGNYSNIHWDYANKQFVFITSTTNSKQTCYFVNTYNPVTKKKVGPSSLGCDPVNKPGNAKKAAQSLLVDAIDSIHNGPKSQLPAKVANYQAPSGTLPPSPNNPDSSAMGPRWNPPPHITTRSVEKFFADNKTSGLVTSDSYITTPSVVNESDAAALKTFFAANGPGGLGSVGTIYQDKSMAASLNQAGNPADGSNIWGFRFMYNPTTIQYNLNTSNSIDWTYGASSPSGILPGNTMFSFTVYLNRISDLSQIYRNINAGMDTNIGSKGWIPSLTPMEVDGLRYRGTEYDIEFLYRVTGGDPILGNQMLGNPGTARYSADYGVLKAIPIWVKLNDNLRIYGTISSLNVNHVMFDKNMVPILTTVDIQIARIPVIFNDGLSSTSSLAKYIASGNVTAATGAT